MTQTDLGLDVRGIVRRVVFFAIVAAVGVALLATLPGVGEVRERLSSAKPGWIAVTAAFSLGSMFGFVRALWAAFDRVIPWRRAVVLGFAEQGANVLLPAGGAGGPALGVVIMRRAGVPSDLAAERHIVLFLATSAVSFVALALAGIGTAIFGDEPAVATLLPAGIAIMVLVAVAAFARWDPPKHRPSDRVMGTVWRVWRFLHGGVRTTVHVLVHGDRLLIVGAITYYACDVAALAASFAAFGGGAPGLGTFLLAYTIGHAGALLPTPGGVGGTEGGLIGMFVLYGASASHATAAVLGYRVFQLGMPAILGAISLLRIRKLLADEANRAEVAARWAAARESHRI
ncbi:MAG TPA: YbhN family protein [Solirubrobacteraceae bacterium]|nr:YbhN family protein [Solirubrobacteraceae bacterium]